MSGDGGRRPVKRTSAAVSTSTESLNKKKKEKFGESKGSEVKPMYSAVKRWRELPQEFRISFGSATLR